MTEKKEYRSAIRSRRLIREAFLALITEKPFEKITVTDITRRADINRSTFYAHYPDVQGLADALTEEIIEDAVRIAQDLDLQQLFSDPAPFVSKLLSLGIDNMDLYKNSRSTDLANRQIEKLKKVLIAKAVNTVDVPERIRRSSAFHIHIHFFIGGIINTYQQWVMGELNCTDQELIDQISALITSNKDLYSRFS